MATTQGFPSRSSVRAGDVLNFHLSVDAAPAGPRTLGVERVRPVLVSAPPTAAFFTTAVPVQSVPTTTDPWEGYGWTPVHAFTVPAAWPSGLYRVHEAGETLFDFVVRAQMSGSTSRILFQIGTNTPQAYWAQGGRSFYSNPRAPRLSYDRPGAMYRQCDPFLQWLENEGIAVEFCTSHDLHELPLLLDDYWMLIIAEHDEYWSKEMRDHVDRFVHNGGNVGVFSGNTCYRQVRLEGPRNHLMSCYKFPAADPITDRNQVPIADRDQVSVAMASPPVCRPTTVTLGAGFSDGAGCWADGSLQTGAAFTVRFPDHWAFGGVTAPTIGTGRVGYETDAVAFVDEPEGYPRVTGEDGLPATYTVLASADLRHWGPGGKPGMATIGLLVRNGMVFNAASVSWQQGLAADPAVRRITRNVIDRLRTRQVWSVWERIGHGNSVTAMTACENKLWCATSDNRLWRRFPMGANAPWTAVGHANGVTSMACAAGRLWCVTNDGRLWRRPPIETDRDWEAVGDTPGGTRAFAATTFLLYRIDGAGQLWMAPARTPVVWEAVPSMSPVREASIRCMVAFGDVLFAATTDNRLLRTQPDLIYESSSWAHVHHCNFATGLAVVDTMMYVTTTENLLWWIDLRGIKAP